MSDKETTPSDLNLLIARMNDLARQIGEMEPDDPLRAVRLQELYTLTELRKSRTTEKAERNGKVNGDGKLPATPVVKKPKNVSIRGSGTNEPAPLGDDRLAFLMAVRMPLGEYAEFMKAVDASSRAAAILKNACYQREMADGRFEQFMEIACTEEELKNLLNLANRYCPAAAPFLQTYNL